MSKANAALSIWDKIYDKLFAYFMEVGKHVE